MICGKTRTTLREIRLPIDRDGFRKFLNNVK